MEELHIRLNKTEQAKFVAPPDLTAEEIKRVALQVYGFTNLSDFYRSVLRYVIREQPVIQQSPRKPKK